MRERGWVSQDLFIQYSSGMENGEWRIASPHFSVWFNRETTD